MFRISFKYVILISAMVMILVGIVIFIPSISSASALSCFQVDGMAIFGYDGSHWIHIGAIGNPFNSDSIANEFGAGSKFKSTSITNEFGRYGSPVSSSSALNELALHPPIIVNDNYGLVGYLTINEVKFPGINTYEAIACAKNSVKSPNYEMKDVEFSDIPSRSGSAPATSQPASTQPQTAPLATPTPASNPVQAPVQITCPLHATNVSGKCICDADFVANNGQCQTRDQNCKALYGPNSYAGTGYCFCNEGYEARSNACAPVASVATTNAVSEAPIVTPPLTMPASIEAKLKNDAPMQSQEKSKAENSEIRKVDPALPQPILTSSSSEATTKNKQPSLLSRIFNKLLRWFK